jgi:hypothetical protein
VTQEFITKRPIGLSKNGHSPPRGERYRAAGSLERSWEDTIMQRLKHYGWGREGEGLSAEEESFVLTVVVSVSA